MYADEALLLQIKILERSRERCHCENMKHAGKSITTECCLATDVILTCGLVCVHVMILCIMKTGIV